jgi:hypothetical protein
VQESRWTPFALVALLGLYWVMAVSASPRMGITADEPVHITGGYACWRFNDYRLQPENGTLAMRVAALPLLAMKLQWVPAEDREWQHSLVNRVAYTFLFRLGNPRDQIVLAARAMIALFGVFTVWLVWRWARGLFGAAGGWVAAVLAAFSPTLLAHGALATSDMAITVCLLATVTAFWRVLHVVTWARLTLAIVAAGAVLLAKMSGVLAAPMLALLLVARWFRPAPLVLHLGPRSRWLRSRTAIVAATLGVAMATVIGSLALLWAGYGFRFSAFAPEYAEHAQLYFSWPAILEEEPLPDAWPGDAPSALTRGASPLAPTLVTRAIAWTRDHRLLPEAYLWGFAHTYKFSRERPAFLNGKYSLTGWHTFFPWTFWLKTTLPTLGLLAAGILALCVRAGSAPDARYRIWYRAAPLIVLFVVYWVVALQTKLNIGHRHILPTYPVVFIGAGAAALWLRHRARALIAVALSLALAAHAGDSLLARPFYLSYFQPVAGGPANGWRHLVDSSYDWGQGLPDLTRWIEQLRANGDSSTVYLTYFGADSPRDRQMPVVRFGDEINDIGPRGFPVRPHGGWFAISATHFQGVYLHLMGPWTADRERLYRKFRAELATPSPVELDASAQAKVLRATMDYEVLEFGRLSQYLRTRSPYAVIGGSILLFHLTDREVAFALTAPWSELVRPSSAGD